MTTLSGTFAIGVDTELSGPFRLADSYKKTSNGGEEKGVKFGTQPFPLVASYEHEGKKFSKRLPNLMFLGGKILDIGAMTLAETGSIQGSVRLVDGKSPLGIDVYIPGTSMTAKAGPDGEFTILFVPEGQYDLIFEKDGYFLKVLPDHYVISKRITFVDPVVLTREDREAPDTSIVEGPGNLTGSLNATFKFTADDGSDSFFCRLDNEAWAPCRSPLTFTRLGEGTHRFAVFAKDASGNQDQSPSDYQWAIDVTPPVLTVTSYPLSITNQLAVSFAFLSPDSTAKFICRLDSQAASECTSPKTYSGLSEGLHSVQIYGEDSVGNRSDLRVISWQVDASAPDTVLLQAPPAFSNNNVSTVAFTATKSGTFSCKLDGGAALSCTSPQTFSGLADGSHAMIVTATDTAGNVDPTPLNVSWTIDSTPPAIPTLNPVPNGLTNDTSPVLGWSAVTGAISYDLQVDVTTSFNSTLTRSFFGVTATSQEVLPSLSDNQWFFRIRATDAAGNRSDYSNALSFNIDSFPAATPVTNYLPDPTNNPRPTFAWQASPEASKYHIQVASNASFTSMLIDSATLTTTSYTPTSDLPGGAIFWKLASIDAAGNKSVFSVAKYFVVDTSAPSAPIVTSIATPTNNKRPPMSWSAVTGAVNYSLQVSTDPSFLSFAINNAALASTSFTPTADFADAIYFWRVAAINAAGTIGGYSEPQTFIVDTAAPPAPALVAYTPSPTNNLLPILTWNNPGVGAVSYNIQVAANSGFSPTLVNQTGVSQTSYTMTVALPIGTIYWRVQARDGAGNTSSWSSSSTLVTTTAATWKYKFLKGRSQFPLTTYADHIVATQFGPMFFSQTDYPYILKNRKFAGNQWSVESTITSTVNERKGYGWMVRTDTSGVPMVSSSVSNGGYRRQFRIFNGISWDLLPNQTTQSYGSYDFLKVNSVIHSLTNESGGLFYQSFDISTNTWSASEMISPDTLQPRLVGGAHSNDTDDAPVLSLNGSTLGMMYRRGLDNTDLWLERDGGVWTEKGMYTSSWSPCNINGHEGFTYVGGMPRVKNCANGKALVWDGANFGISNTTDKRYRLRNSGAAGESDTTLDYYNGSQLLSFPIEDDTGQVLTTVSTTAHWGVKLNEFANPVALIKNLRDLKWEIAPAVGLTTMDVGAGIGSFTSLAYKSDGKPMIAYHSGPSAGRQLRRAVYDGTSWSIETVDNTIGAGEYASMQLKSNGKAVIAYHQANLGYLQIATEGVGWTIDTVDNTANVGKFASLALRSDDNPVIAYYDATNGNLKLATFDGTSWSRQTVAYTGDVGQYASLKLDTSNNPRIAYYDASTGSLKYASFDGTSWTVSTVDSSADVGQSARLALKADGTPMIAYYDLTNQDLKFAEWTGSTWAVSTLQSEGDRGETLDLVVDTVGNPHVCFYDKTNGNLLYGNRNTNWAFRTIDGDESANDSGSYCSMGINPVNKSPTAAYQWTTQGGVSLAEGMVLY